MRFYAFVVGTIMQNVMLGYSVYSFFSEDQEAALYWVLCAIYIKLINPVPPPPLPKD